jgi:flagellin-specific chaperone FliS
MHEQSLDIYLFDLYGYANSTLTRINCSVGLSRWFEVTELLKTISLNWHLSGHFVGSCTEGKNSSKTLDQFTFYDKH